MRTIKKSANTLLRLVAIALAMLLPLAIPDTPAAAQQFECANRNGGQFKAVALAKARTTTWDFSGSAGQLDPMPLLETEIDGGSTCVVVHFSAQADPQDNFIMFQASIDDIPMQGHAQFPYLSPAPATPVVFDPEETNLNISRMVSYTFFSRVGHGKHTVRIRFAGCCSTNPSNGMVVRAAVMSVQY